jgi:outer membrane protein OmpA-like peptidoglycan-associated protein
MRGGAQGMTLDALPRMTGLRLALALATISLLPTTTAAQDISRSIRTAASCAPVGTPASSRGPRITLASSDARMATTKSMFVAGERITLGRGTDAGVQPGQTYVVRRPMRFFGAPRAQHTLGWLHVVEASGSTATAQIDFTCDAMTVGDLLEPFSEPTLPVGVDRTFGGGTLDSTREMRLTYGVDGRALQGGRDFVLADEGEADGVRAGDRYAVFRPDIATETTPAVAEAVVVTVFEEQSLLRITDARDGVFTGDRLVLRVGASDPRMATSSAATAVARATASPTPPRATARPATDALSTSAAASADRSPRADDRRVTFDDVYFGLDRATLRPEARRRLDEAAKTLQADPAMRAQIEGHTCDVGTAEYNLVLGQRRADAVRAYLVSKGIAENRLSTISYGEEKPSHDNSKANGRPLNRRAVVTVSLQH